MKRTIAIISIVLIVGVVAVVAIAGFGDDNDADNANKTTTNTTDTSEITADTGSETDVEEPQLNEVSIKDLAFAPETLTIAKGTTVIWTNNDDVQHDITPDSPSDNFVASSLLSEGETYNITFSVPGTYTYHCSLHPHMKATIVVTE